MHLLHGNSLMESRDYEGAIRSFECARTQMRPHASRELVVASLVSLLLAMALLQYIEISYV